MKNNEKRLLLTQQIEDIALELNDGVKIDFYNYEQLKYAFFYSFKEDKFHTVESIDIKIINITYCLSIKFLETVQERISKEDLLFLVRG